MKRVGAGVMRLIQHPERFIGKNPVKLKYLIKKDAGEKIAYRAKPGQAAAPKNPLLPFVQL